MSPAAIILVLLAAFAHAAWNLLAKRLADFDAVAYLWLAGVCSTVLYAPLALAAAVVERPRLGWPQLGWTLASAVLHLAYFLLLQRGYRSGDLSLVYPLARGTGPMLSSLAAMLVLGERPGAWGVAGILLVGAGVFLLGLPDRRVSSAAAIWFGLATGLFIAAYTLWDKRGVTALGIPPLIYNWGEEVGRAAMLSPLALRSHRRETLRLLWTTRRAYILACGALMPLSYLLVLTALRFSDVSAIAPAREVSVLIGVALGGRLLAEGGLRRRLLASAAIAVGVIAIAVG
ncbi:MAG TPA: DMT family transporter [Streptosporangiaceae bacterium]|nr:DMT family transporter [Streptosporangiaceae bacterium]